MITMKTFIIVSQCFILLSANICIGQESLLSLSFTGIKNETYLQLSKVEIRNLNSNSDTTIYWPDTVLSIKPLNVNELPSVSDELEVFQNVPNPVTERTKILLFVPESDEISIRVSLVNGDQVASLKRKLQRGFHTFLFTPGGSDLFLFTVSDKAMMKSIKIISSMTGSPSGCTLAYFGMDPELYPSKPAQSRSGFTFSMGDTLRFTGYSDSSTTAFQDAPTIDSLFTINFPGTGISCQGLPSVTYMGQTYNTVLIGTQCWLRENLNAGVRIDGIQEQTDNGIIEKYCYDNDINNCTVYGGLYQWHEIMQYDLTPGTQGICPQNWHIPTSNDWQTLAVFLGGLIEAGGKMKTTGTIEAGTGLWKDPNESATNESGFSALPSGGRFLENGMFYSLGQYCAWWSSSESYPGFAWMRYIYYDNHVLDYWGWFMNEGFSVRCVSDH
jgi:uncharacterized protein (TIGR02145 family)